MNKKYSYWDNSKWPNSVLVFECVAETIIQADKKMEEITGINPVKTPIIGCKIENLY